MSEGLENTLSAYLGHEFQLRLMWQLLVEPEFAEKTIPNLAIEYFDDPNMKRMFVIMLEFHKEYEKVPNLQNQTIHQAINRFKTPNNYIEEETLFSTLRRIENWNERVINEQMLYDGDVIQKATIEFIKQQEYRKLGEFILDKVKSGEMKNKFILNNIEDKFLKISEIGNEDNTSEEVIENPEKALRKEFRETIPTGIEAIDTLTGGGLAKCERGIILASPGTGKTTLLTKIANTGYEVGKNVAQIIIEDNIDDIKRKHYAIWSKVPLSKLSDDDENKVAIDRVKKKIEMIKGKGRLVIQKFSEEGTTMIDIRNWIISYQKKHGMKFDLLILDYLDCIESHKRTADKNEAEFNVIKSFGALGTDLNIPAWTSIQGNRGSFNVELVEAFQMGGSVKRYEKAHFFMSIGKTPDQKEASLANIRIIKARFAKDGQTFKDCIFNNDTLDIRIEDQRYKNGGIINGVKRYDEKDLNELEEQRKRIVEKSSDLNIHNHINLHLDDQKVNNNTSILSEIENNNELMDYIKTARNEIKD
jgi:replicative DNA helicase